MKRIDIDNWDRKSHYEWFGGFSHPCVAFDVKFDITEVIAFCKRKKVSSFATLMYLMTDLANHNFAFRLREDDKGVVEVDYANASYTYLINEHTFVNLRARANLGFQTFLQDVENNKNKYRGSDYVQEIFNDVSIINDIYFSCVPWFDYLSVHQPIPDNDKGNRSIPRFLWGKYIEENDRTYIVVNITANHALVDGVDFANIVEAMKKAFANPEEYINNSEVNV